MIFLDHLLNCVNERIRHICSEVQQYKVLSHPDRKGCIMGTKVAQIKTFFSEIFFFFLIEFQLMVFAFDDNSLFSD